jgi:hypothetical protein
MLRCAPASQTSPTFARGSFPRQADDVQSRIMISLILVALSAAIVLTLGMIHLLYTFSGPKLHPRERRLKRA